MLVCCYKPQRRYIVMRYCYKCGQKLIEGAAFCTGCGTAVEVKSIVPVPLTAPAFEEKLRAEECAFLATTHRLLRWELKAWNIAAKVLNIMGIVYAALFMTFFLVGLIAVFSDEGFGTVAMVMGLSYAIIFGGMFIGLGVVSKKAGEKLPQYINTVYTDFSITYNRCGNIGMLIFTIFLGIVSPIFFIINFVRMKANRDVIERITKKQNVHR